MDGWKRKLANFVPYVKVVKRKTKVCNVCFFNRSFIKRARVLILELHEGTMYTIYTALLSSNIRALALILSEHSKNSNIIFVILQINKNHIKPSIQPSQ